MQPSNSSIERVMKQIPFTNGVATKDDILEALESVISGVMDCPSCGKPWNTSRYPVHNCGARLKGKL